MRKLHLHDGERFWDRVAKAVNSGLVSNDYATGVGQFVTSTYKDGSIVVDDIDNGVPYSIEFPDKYATLGETLSELEAATAPLLGGRFTDAYDFHKQVRTAIAPVLGDLTANTWYLDVDIPVFPFSVNLIGYSRENIIPDKRFKSSLIGRYGDLNWHIVPDYIEPDMELADVIEAIRVHELKGRIAELNTAIAKREEEIATFKGYITELEAQL